jgi:hypothetical protein
MCKGYGDSYGANVLKAEHEEAERLRFEAQEYDFVLNLTSTGAGSNYPIPIPKGANRVEVLCKVAPGATGDLQVWRQVSKVTDPSGRPLQVIAATLAFNTNGTRTVFELPPNVGRLYAVASNIAVGSQMSVVVSFWRVG